MNNTLTVSINGTNIERLYITTFFSVLIDQQLDWTDHIKRKTN